MDIRKHSVRDIFDTARAADLVLQWAVEKGYEAVMAPVTVRYHAELLEWFVKGKAIDPFLDDAYEEAKAEAEAEREDAIDAAWTEGYRASSDETYQDGYDQAKSDFEEKIEELEKECAEAYEEGRKDRDEELKDIIADLEYINEDLRKQLREAYKCPSRK